MTELSPPDDLSTSSGVPPEQLEEWLAIESVEKLATRISHDLIQPLSEIVNHVWFCRELVGRSPAMTEVHQSLTSIEDQAMQVAEMIRVVRRLVCTWDHGTADTIS
jgi:light-regulated signal transduction histidine kinase (bacteriophytochrome)